MFYQFLGTQIILSQEYMDDLPLEQCWVPGGVHERLVFPAVILFFVYCLGFPLIVGSILSKKLCEDLNAMVLDIKCGPSALM